MTTYLELTEHDETEVTIAVHQIVAVRRQEEGCYVITAHGLRLDVQQSYNDVCGAILAHVPGAHRTTLPVPRKVSSEQLRASAAEWRQP